MRLLVASDIHCDLEACAGLVERSREADAVVIAGDFAKVHKGLAETIRALKEIETALVIPGNNETPEALAEACEGWEAARVLHGEAAEVDGLTVFGLGGGVPPIGKAWSFDLDEEAARRRLAECPDEVDVLLVHSPPYGHVDAVNGRHVGSRAILETIEVKRPRLVVCGHIHDCWRQESHVGGSRVINAGPLGRIVEL